MGKLTEEECKNCWAYRYCYLCCKYADNLEELSREVRMKNCNAVKFDTLEDLKQFCTLNELGCKFDDAELSYVLGY